MESIGETSASLNASFEDVARFLHINPYSASTLASTLIFNGSTTSYEQKLNVSLAKWSLGNDMGHMPDNPLTYNGSIVSQTFSTSNPSIYNKYAYDLSSLPIYIYYNASSAHLGPNDSDGNGDHNLVYGFARKYKQLLDPNDYISFTTKRIGGIHIDHFQDGIRIPYNNPDVPSASAVAGWPFVRGLQIFGSSTFEGGARRLGYDYHFNAFGNTAIALSSGFHPLQYYGQQEYTDGQDIRQVYCGANNCLFNFNTTESRFELSNLHSPEKVGNFYNAGDPTPANTVFGPPATGQAGNDCFKINKQLKYDSWSPCLQPYSKINLTSVGTDPAAISQKTFIDVNPNLSLGVVYDSHGGVVIEDMGITEDKWTDSIWGLLGFEYGQFNASGSLENINNYNFRITNDTVNVSGVTTNANITSSTGQQFFTNVYGVNMFNSMLESKCSFYNTSKTLVTVSAASASHIVPPTIVVGDIESTKIKAKQIPRKLLKGYFLINSDILDSANYYQLANPLQTMAIVGKYNGANDFVNYEGGGAVFTVTNQKTITAIKTQILDPEGSLAQVGDNSGVIYRIDKQIKTDLNFAENLMAGAYGKSPS